MMLGACLCNKRPKQLFIDSRLLENYLTSSPIKVGIYYHGGNRGTNFGWKSSPDTQSLCPSPVMIKSPAGSPHIRHVPSSEAVTTTGFFGCSITLQILQPMSQNCFHKLQLKIFLKLPAFRIIASVIPKEPKLKLRTELSFTLFCTNLK
jgi:hypothetical protein